MVPPATSDFIPVGSRAPILGLFAVWWDWWGGKEKGEVVYEEGNLEASALSVNYNGLSQVGNPLHILQQMHWH